jgi:hypothetical protein
MSLLHTLILLLGVYLLVASAQDFTCGPDKPCALGCCSKTGVCGLGPTFCGPGNCTSSCNAKSECDPGWGVSGPCMLLCHANVLTNSERMVNYREVSVERMLQQIRLLYG